MLPFRVEQCYNDLVKAIRDGRLVDKPGQFPRDEHATKWAGYLAHYAADNTQPQHATIDYKSQSYFGKDTRRAPNVHADMEYRLVDGEDADYPELREELWKVLVAALDTVKDPATSRDPWVATLEVALSSYDALPLIGRAGKAAYTLKAGGETEFNADAFFRFKGDVRGEPTTVLEMKARQMALGVRRIETLWLNAWADAKAQGQAKAAR